MIRVLPRDVVDRIAAGEVVARRASVVQELIENALDAGATRIDVAIEDGGLGLIRVADDGRGLQPAELPLAFASHATSKLHDVDDLAHIASYGFRGEALASIAAVARCRLTSRPAGAEAGLRVDAAAGHIGAPEQVAAGPGTIVEVRDLFFNTPARRQFLGAANTEAARCREVCASMSLVLPGVRIRLQIDGQARFTGGGDASSRSRLVDVYGAELLAEMVPVRARADELAVEGWLSLPSAARARPRAQQLFVNQRLVRDRAVAAAVRSACFDFLPRALQPSWVLLLSIDPARVDVNVHPTKAEVRFRDGDAVFRTIRSACRTALLGSNLVPELRAESFPAALGAVRSDGERVAEDVRTPPGEPASAGLFVPTGTRATDAPSPPVAPLPVARTAARFLQILRTYIVHDSPDGLVLVDQHALHERILYARLVRARDEGRLGRQQLLVPEVARLSPLLHARALEQAESLAQLGLLIEAFGPESIAIRAVPAVLREESPQELLRALLDPVDAHGGIPHGLDRRLFTMACHAAVKAGDDLDASEIADLLRQGAELEHDATCPHGRPTRLRIGRAELERLFKRSGF